MRFVFFAAGRLIEPPLTKGQAIEYAKATIERVLDSVEKAKIKDVTKAEYCESHGWELKQEIGKAEGKIEIEQGVLEKLKHTQETCGCCCDTKTALDVPFFLQKSEIYQKD